MKSILITAIIFSFFACNEGEDKTTIVYRDQAQREDQDNSVTSEFGALRVQIGEQTFRSDKTPWSSGWFPYRENFLAAEGKSSPLGKYDTYVRKVHRQDSEAQNQEMLMRTRVMDVHWAGLCHAWAVASILHPEPTQAQRKAGIQFSIVDQKALLAKSYENVKNLKIHGELNTGENDGAFEDIYPDQLIKLVKVFLGERRQSILMDHDPGTAVWTVPVYRAKLILEPKDSATVQGSIWLTYADYFSLEEFHQKGIQTGTDTVNRSYMFELSGRYEGDDFVVDGGEWIGASVKDHPDYLIEYPETASLGSYNKEFKPEIALEIVKSQ